MVRLLVRRNAVLMVPYQMLVSRAAAAKAAGGSIRLMRTLSRRDPRPKKPAGTRRRSDWKPRFGGV
jgi:hypothetical protein